MSLLELCDNTKSDKNTTHSYLELYEKILNNKKKYSKKCVRNWCKRWRQYKIMA